MYHAPGPKHSGSPVLYSLLCHILLIARIPKLHMLNMSTTKSTVKRSTHLISLQLTSLQSSYTIVSYLLTTKPFLKIQGKKKDTMMNITSVLIIRHRNSSLDCWNPTKIQNGTQCSSCIFYIHIRRMIFIVPYNIT